jgi:hypothetical protein
VETGCMKKTIPALKLYDLGISCTEKYITMLKYTYLNATKFFKINK